jgi:hypothetical protein
MPQFSLDEMTQVTISNVNIRSELHGTEHVPAVDIDVKLTASNDILSMFHGSLKSMFYGEANGASGEQPELEGVPPVSSLTRLLCPYLEPISIKREHAGYELTIDHGTGGDRNIVMGQCEVNKFKVDLKEGGSVELKFRVQAAGLDEATLGKVGTLIGREVPLMLTAPEEKQQELSPGEPKRGDSWPFPDKAEPIDGTTEAFKKDHPDATDAFVAAHTGDEPAPEKPAGKGKRGKAAATA